jgi:hypothetical protein
MPPMQIAIMMVVVRFILFNNSGLVLAACILAGNTAMSGNGPDLWMESGAVTANNCLVSDNTSSTLTDSVNGNQVGSSAAPLDALLAPLGNYGGLTLAIPPLASSPAVDTGGATTLTTDQRGFPRVSGNAVDIGAVEVQMTGTTNPPVLAQVLITPDHTFQCTFTNTTGSSYRVLTSTNLALPLANWSPVVTVTESPAGQYQFTQTGVTNAAQFYRVVSP